MQLRINDESHFGSVSVGMYVYTSDHRLTLASIEFRDPLVDLMVSQESQANATRLLQQGEALGNELAVSGGMCCVYQCTGGAGRHQ